MGFTSVFKSVPPNELKNIGLFILLWLWPAVYAPSPHSSDAHSSRTDCAFSLCRAALLYCGIMCYIVITILEERKPCRVFSSSSSDAQR